MFTPSRDQVRRFFCDTWRKHRDRNILEGLEATALDIVLAHPEYHALLDAPEAAVETDYTPEQLLNRQCLAVGFRSARRLGNGLTGAGLAVGDLGGFLENAAGK